MEEIKKLKIPLEDIKVATKNFSDKCFIGIGGFGRVYSAKISLCGQQRTVAIKRLAHNSKQGEHEFLKEIQMLSIYRNKNIIGLLGFCNESSEKILVYEYAENGSLDKHISRTELSWMQRLQISIDAARGFKYLHSDLGPQHRILHRDIKSSNILLDENWVAKISDFGLSKLAPSNVDFTFLVTVPCGTIGYIDPQFYKTGIFSKESDVYSFGVVLFEILCGKLASTKHQDEDLLLSSLAQKFYEQNRLVEIIHPDLQNQIKPDCLEVFAMVAYKCMKENRRERPTMDWILEKLENALKLQDGCTVSSFIRITCDRQLRDPQTCWSFALEEDHHLLKITIDHGDAIRSLIFTSESNGVMHTSGMIGGEANGDKTSEVLFDGDEEITGIEVSIHNLEGSMMVSSLSFMTTKRTHGPFGKETENIFSLPFSEGSLVGFYGHANDYIESIGVYVKASTEIIRVGTWGTTRLGSTDNDWSLQVEKNHNLKKITIGHGNEIRSLMFTTEHRGLLNTSGMAGGWKGSETYSEVTLDWDEEIKAINGTVDQTSDRITTFISSISFVTNKKIHGTFGYARGKPFELQWEDASFAGLYGLSGWFIDSLGVYLKATT